MIDVVAPHEAGLDRVRVYTIALMRVSRRGPETYPPVHIARSIQRPIGSSKCHLVPIITIPALSEKREKKSSVSQFHVLLRLASDDASA